MDIPQHFVELKSLDGIAIIVTVCATYDPSPVNPETLVIRPFRPYKTTNF